MELHSKSHTGTAWRCISFSDLILSSSLINSREIEAFSHQPALTPEVIYSGSRSLINH